MRNREPKRNLINQGLQTGIYSNRNLTKREKYQRENKEIYREYRRILLEKHLQVRYYDVIMSTRHILGF